MPEPLRAITLPSRDEAFRRVVERGLREPDLERPSDLEDWIRPLYPSTYVRARDLTGETRPTWYVYRDGSFAPESVEAWWTVGRCAEVWLSTSDGRVMYLNDELADLIASTHEEILGDDYLNYVVPDARDGARILFETALLIPELRSLVRLLRRGGETITCEFRSQTTASEIRVWFRPVGVIGEI